MIIPFDANLLSSVSALLKEGETIEELLSRTSGIYSNVLKPGTDMPVVELVIVLFTNERQQIRVEATEAFELLGTPSIVDQHFSVSVLATQPEAYLWYLSFKADADCQIATINFSDGPGKHEDRRKARSVVSTTKGGGGPLEAGN